MMPEYNGITVTKLIKQVREFREIPVLIFTARRSKGDIDAAVQAGAQDYIIKPFDVENVLAKVKRALTPQEERARVRREQSENPTKRPPRQV